MISVLLGVMGFGCDVFREILEGDGREGESEERKNGKK